MAIKSAFWDKRYSANEYVYGKEPNSYFKKQLNKLPVGNILLVGEGEGRNGVYAARQGWNVSAFDISVEGKRKAERLANKYNVKIDYRVGELHEQSYQKEQFDVIALICTHFPTQSREAIFKELMGYLRSDGTLIMEVYSTKQLNYQVKGDSFGGPKDIDMLYTTKGIKADFKNLELIELEETEKRLSNNNHNNALSCVIRFVGVKNG